MRPVVQSLQKVVLAHRNLPLLLASELGVAVEADGRGVDFGQLLHPLGRPSRRLVVHGEGGKDLCHLDYKNCIWMRSPCPPSFFRARPCARPSTISIQKTRLL